ncbi:MAG: JAB domain-containing protein [Bacteroidetes bacterium]|nr:JAB domain-containing protein [Bacteroidota bacterium]
MGIYLRRNNTIIKDSFISKGDISGTVVNIKAILSDAILLKASSIILAHNHPSGEMKPSSADISITTQIKSAAKLIDVTLLDHVIIGLKSEFYSFADNGIL